MISFTLQSGPESDTLLVFVSSFARRVIFSIFVYSHVSLPSADVVLRCK